MTGCFLPAAFPYIYPCLTRTIFTSRPKQNGAKPAAGKGKIGVAPGRSVFSHNRQKAVPFFTRYFRIALTFL